MVIDLILTVAWFAAVFVGIVSAIKVLATVYLNRVEVRRSKRAATIVRENWFSGIAYSNYELRDAYMADRKESAR